MPRIRSIKPEFWTSGQVLECSTNARLLFIGLWNFCDDQGRHSFRAKQIKAEVFPADEFTPDDILRMLDELSSNGLIALYEHDNQRFLQVLGWKHQKIDRPQPAKHPGPFDDGSTIVRGAFVPDRIGKDTIGEDGKGNGANAPVESAKNRGPDRSGESQEVFDYWQQELNHPRAKLDAKRDKAIKARLKDGYTVSDLKAAIDGIQKSAHHMGENDRNALYDDIELICRDGPHVDKFIKLADGPNLTRMSSAARKTLTAAQRWIDNG